MDPGVSVGIARECPLSFAEHFGNPDLPLCLELPARREKSVIGASRCEGGHPVGVRYHCYPS